MKRPMLSLYLHVDNARPENQSDTPAWKIELKNAMRDQEDDVMYAENRERWHRIQNRVTDFFTDYFPAGRSLVLLTDGEQLEHYELPIPLGSDVRFGEPYLLPLIWALDEYERYLILQVDREQARFISGYLGSANNAGEMRLDLESYDFRQKQIMPAQNSTQANGGNDIDRYDKMIDEHVKRFYSDVVNQLRTLQQEMNTRRVILSGDEKSAHMLMEQIPEADRKYIVGIAPAPLSYSEGDVLDRVLETAITYERNHEDRLVNQVINDAKAGGRGALGVDDVIEALINQQVEMLLLPYPPRADDIADDLKQRAFDQGVEIELVHGQPADTLTEAGGVAARLYYSL